MGQKYAIARLDKHNIVELGAQSVQRRKKVSAESRETYRAYSVQLKSMIGYAS
jgi:hypothetical protein